MPRAITKFAESSFDRRYYEGVRRRALAKELGNIAVSSAAENWQGFEQRQYEEVTSGLAEALPGVVKTEYPFELHEGKLVASDGQSIEQLLLNGQDNDRQMTEQDDFYKAFLSQRSHHELEEFYQQEAMANEEVGYNTLVTFSPYSEEFHSENTTSKIVKAGQKPYWKRAMLRVSHWDGSQMHIFTRSVDNSSVRFLKDVAKQNLDYEFKAQHSTDMLGERIKMDIEDESWKELADSIVGTADRILAENHGGMWRQGRTREQAKDLQIFVESETQIVNSLLDTGKDLAVLHPNFQSYKKAFDNEMYNHIALLEKRLDLGIKETITNIKSATGGAGAIARSEGKVYDMCGNVVGANGSSAAAQTAGQTGFESLNRLTNKEVQCPFCKEKVIVPKEDLEKGKLYCTECDTGVDVCTGEKFSRGRRFAASSRKLGFFELISEDLTRFEQINQEKEIVKRRKERLQEQEQTHDFNLAA